MDFKVASELDLKGIYDLWQSVFQDDFNTINTFFKHLNKVENIIVCKCDDKIISMLVLIENEIVINKENHKAYYIYAAATDENYRKKGIMSKLLEFAQEIAAKRKADYVFLRPASEYLYSYYQKNGFETVFYQSAKILYNQNDKYDYDFVLWNDEVIKLDKIFSDNDTISNENGYVNFTQKDNEVTINHFVSENVFELIEDIKEKTNAEKIYVSLPVKDKTLPCEKMGMIKPLSNNKLPESVYLGITLE